MKKTKIICTMGPNTNNRELLSDLVNNGMDVARFNFSHGDHEEHLGRIQLVKEVRTELSIPVAMLLDTKGPEIRTGVLKDHKKVQLNEAEEFTLVMEEIEGDEKRCSITYPELTKDVKKGDFILIDDGLIELVVKKVSEREIECVVVNGGELGERKGVNVPNVSVNLPGVTDKDKEDILFGIEQGFDFIAASFVRNAQCIRDIKKLLKDHQGEHINVIAKIENAEGIANIDEIIDAADGIMVARGDLGVEIPADEVPYIQKKIINKCNEHYKPVITATQMLDSMIRNPRPTRAEAGDVANAVYDGSDAIMLSGETAMGKYPLEALKMMVKIAETTELHLDYKMLVKNSKSRRKKNISSAVGFATVSTARNLDAACIVIPTISGQTARLISNFRPEMPIYAISPNECAVRRMQLYWGVYPMKGNNENTTEHIISSPMVTLRQKNLVNKGDLVIFTAGDPATNVVTGEGAITNMMHVLQAK